MENLDQVGFTPGACIITANTAHQGKTVMCSFIIKELIGIEGSTTCYFFCNNQEAGNISSQLLTIIILQILRQHPEISTLIANEYVYRGANCGMAQLRTLVPQLLMIVPFIRIVVDGVDECSTQNQKSVLKELRALCTGPDLRCKVLFSSRREVHIREQLSKRQICLDGRPEVDCDIRSFVRYKISELQTSDQQLPEKIESILVQKANGDTTRGNDKGISANNSIGMFLWVKLVVDELRYCYNDTALEETAISLPKGLKAAYAPRSYKICCLEMLTEF